jgi:hypothetical protein
MVLLTVCSIACVSGTNIDSITELYDYIGSDYSFDVDKIVTIVPEDYMSLIDLLFKLLIPIVNNLFCLNISV